MNDINFFVSFIEHDKRIRRKNYFIFLCVIIFVAVIGTVYYYADREQRMVEKNIAQLKEYVTSAEVNTKLIEIREKNSELTLLNNYYTAIKAISFDFARSNILTNDFISLINSTVPQNIVLDNISYTDTVVTFSGTSADRIEIAEFYYNLKQLDVFYDIYLGAITAFEIIEGEEENEATTQGYSFAMQCHLKGGEVQ